MSQNDVSVRQAGSKNELAPSESGGIKGNYFELYGAKELAVSMLGEAARTLALDPKLSTKEGVLTEQWVRDGRTGALSFETCLEIAGIDEVNGQNMVEAIREQLIDNPRHFFAAIKSVEKSIRQECADQSDADDSDDLAMQHADAGNGRPLSLDVMYSPQTNTIEVAFVPPPEVATMRAVG